MTKTWTIGGKAALAAALAMVLFGAACCANGDNALQQQYSQAYGDSQAAAPARSDYWYFDRSDAPSGRETSDLLSDVVTPVVNTVVDTTTATVDAVTTTDPAPAPVTASVSVAITTATSFLGGSTSIAVITSNVELHEARVVFSSGRTGGESFSGTSGRVSWSGSEKLSYLTVLLRDGSKWFFDRAGAPLPNGYKPAITMVYKNNMVSVTSSDTFDKVGVVYTDGTRDVWSAQGTTGTFKPFRGKTVARMSVRLKADGSKWYFDNAGACLPCDSKWYTDLD